MRRRSWRTSSATSSPCSTTRRSRRAPRSTATAAPALGADGRDRNLGWVRPLSDPVGGTAAVNGRHPAKMIEPAAPEGAPELRRCRSSSGRCSSPRPACACTATPSCCASPRPSTATTSCRSTRRCGSSSPASAARWPGTRTAGRTGTAPTSTPARHGFNFMAQLYGCTSANGLWVVPGSHREGKVDIKAMVDGRRLRAPARRRAARVRARRRGHHQPPGDPRLVRQHQPRPAGHDQLRLPPPASVLGVDERRGAQRRSPCTTRTASTSARRRSRTASTPGPSASRTRTATCTRPFAGQRGRLPLDARDDGPSCSDYNLLDLGI